MVCKILLLMWPFEPLHSGSFAIAPKEPPPPDQSKLVCLDYNVQSLPFWPFKGGFKVSSGTVKWYRSRYGTDFDNSEIASPDVQS